MSRILIVALVMIVSARIDYVSVQSKVFFEIILDRVEKLQESPSISEWNLRVKKINKTRALVGSLICHEPIGNNFQAAAKVLKKQGGEYRYTPYSVPPGPFCDVTSKDKYVYPDIAKHSDFPEDITNNCPLPAGNYSLYGLTFSLDTVPLIMLSSGEYAVEIFFHKDNNIISIYRLFAFVNKV